MTRGRAGLGIGLSIVKRLVEMHGGHVRAQSAGTGRGATFELHLPLLERMPEAHAVARDENVIRRRVLVVDDNRDAAESLAMMLRSEGHEVEAVFSADKALARMAQCPPDVVLLDIGLPGLDGYQIVRRLRAQQQLSQVRVVALTGYGQSEDRQRALEAGFDTHLVKPASLEALAQALQGSTGASGRQP